MVVVLLRCPGSRQASAGWGCTVDATVMTLPCTSFKEAGVSKPNTRLPCDAQRQQGLSLVSQIAEVMCIADQDLSWPHDRHLITLACH